MLLRRVCCWGPVGRRYRSTAASAGRRSSTVHNSTAFGSECEQCQVVSRRTKLSTDLFVVICWFSDGACSLQVLGVASSQDVDVVAELRTRLEAAGLVATSSSINQPPADQQAATDVTKQRLLRLVFSLSRFSLRF